MNVCRVCLRNTGVYFKMYCSAQEGLQIGEILKLCVAEVDLTLSKLPVICADCIKLVNAAYTLRKVCLLTESHINEYIQHTKSYSPTIDLKDVVQIVYKDKDPPPPLYQKIQGEPEGPEAETYKRLNLFTPIQPNPFSNTVVLQNSFPEGSVMPVHVPTPLIVCGISNNTSEQNLSEVQNTTSTAIVLSATKTVTTSVAQVSSSTGNQTDTPKRKRTRTKRALENETSSKNDGRKPVNNSQGFTIGSVVSLQNESNQGEQTIVADKAETLERDGKNQSTGPSKESSTQIEVSEKEKETAEQIIIQESENDPLHDCENDPLQENVSDPLQESVNDPLQETENDPLQENPITETNSKEDPKATSTEIIIEDDVIIQEDINEPVVITDDEDDDDVQVISETAGDNLNTLLKNTPHIENMDIPELVSVSRVVPVDQSGRVRRGPTASSTPSTSSHSTPQPSTSNNSKNPADAKPIKVVNPKTNQVQIIGYILNPDSQGAKKSNTPVSKTTRTQIPYTVTKSSDPPATKPITRSATTPSKPPRTFTESDRSNENSQDSAASEKDKKPNELTAKDHRDELDNLLRPTAEEEDEDNPEYVSLQAFRTDQNKSLQIKREATSDDENNSPKKKKINTTEDPLNMVPFVKLESIDPLCVMVKQEPIETEDPLSTIQDFGKPDESDPEYNPSQSEDDDYQPASPIAKRQKRRSKPPARYIAPTEDETKKRRRRAKKAEPSESAEAVPQNESAEAVPQNEIAEAVPQNESAEAVPQNVDAQKVEAQNVEGQNVEVQPTESVSKRKGKRKKTDKQVVATQAIETMIGEAGVYHFLSDFPIVSGPPPPKKKRGRKKKSDQQANNTLEDTSVGLFHSLFGDIGKVLPAAEDYIHASPGYSNAGIEMDTSSSNIESSRLGDDNTPEKDGTDTNQNSNIDNEISDCPSRVASSVYDENAQNTPDNVDPQVQSDKQSEELAFDENTRITDNSQITSEKEVVDDTFDENSCMSIDDNPPQMPSGKETPEDPLNDASLPSNNITEAMEDSSSVLDNISVSGEGSKASGEESKASAEESECAAENLDILGLDPLELDTVEDVPEFVNIEGL